MLPTGKFNTKDYSTVTTIFRSVRVSMTIL